jgi:hypothetical protein
VINEEQTRALREFFLRCIDCAFAADVDATDVQDWAIELGLCVADVATEDDCGHPWYDGEPGDTIYRVVAWIQST